jgi:hypothetical protein
VPELEWNKVKDSPPSEVSGRERLWCVSKMFVHRQTEQSRCQIEEGRSACSHSLHKRWQILGLEQQPPVFAQRGQVSARYPSRQEFAGCSLEPRLGWYLAFVKLLEALPPPGELDCGKRRLAGSGDDIRHRFIDVEKRIEGRPQLGRPVEPDEIAVAQALPRT